MEEELNENELEERFYSMLHYVDDTQANVTANHDSLKVFESAPRSTLRRYWRTSGEAGTAAPLNTPFQKVNIPREAPKPPSEEPKPKEEKTNPLSEPFPNHLSLFNSPVPKDVKKTIEILETDNSKVVELDSSDEDEVIEVALPPKPTITIESSDEEISINDTSKKAKKRHTAQEKGSPNGEREISASPVPSIVSSVSDDFIRGDCIALNITSRRPNNPSFDFSLHGADILFSTPSKKKKKKKNKENATPTPITVEAAQNKLIVVEECFATPKNKAKNKKQKNKSYIVTEKSVPNADVYDSDSNQSIVENNTNHNSCIIVEKSFPCVDVFETGCNLSETIDPKSSDTNAIATSDSSISLEKSLEETPKSKKDICQPITINLTEDSPEDDNIEENIVIGNVSGFTECDDNVAKPITVDPTTVTKYGSTKVPAILYENLDFGNLKGKEKVCKNRRYSLTTLRAEMEKFYNESWGGEDFNHREIQKNMSRDKSLWAIDPKDRVGTYTRKKYNVTCNYCNRAGHRDDTCRLKPAVCFMCGKAGHVEPRCPTKICVNCGSPNYMYSTMCRNCCHWGRVRCIECGQPGHPQTHCPDIWRRYHNTLDITPHLEENRYTKKHYQLFCSGCARRGHLAHSCRVSLPYSGLPINSPYVSLYAPVYLPATTLQSQDSTISSASTPKRPSKSPTVHEAHPNKKRNVSLNESADVPNIPRIERRKSQSKDAPEENSKQPEAAPVTSESVEKAPDFIPIFSNNHDNQGQVIQDNEVSDTSDVVTSARVYVTDEVIKKLKSDDGVNWLKEITEKLKVGIETDDEKSFLRIKGKVGDQESFQTALRDWAKDKSEQKKSDNEGIESGSKQPNKEAERCTMLYNDIPKIKCKAMRHLKKALESLDKKVAEPNALFKELNYHQRIHQKLLKQKVISPLKLENARNKIKDITKKLNLVLLGQAGLADGSKHVKALYNIHGQLVNHRDKKISVKMRESIGKHFHSIFTNEPRNDYEQLLKAYNAGRHSKVLYKKQKRQLKFNTQPKIFDTIPGQKNTQKKLVKKVKTDIQKNPDASSNQNPNAADITKNELVSYLKQLQSTRPIDNVLKKTRSELLRRLHVQIHINSLGKNLKKNSRVLKKMKLVQEQVQLFLTNV